MSEIRREKPNLVTEGALAPAEFGGSEKRTERETDNLLLIAPSESKS